MHGKESDNSLIWPTKPWGTSTKYRTINGIPTDANYTLPEISHSAGCTDDTWTATSLTDAPDARANHTAVWTGNEMIVWCGFNGSFLNTGGRYNPGADS
jgi:hypothetical protein